MLMAGKHVTQVSDQLQALSVERMHKGLINSEGPLVAMVQQLRALKTMQPDAYRKAKTQLPYVVCGHFVPAVRRKENFAWIEHFIIDIDKLSLQATNPDSIKRLLQQDDRVALLFTSPGNDGVKALFNLGHRIHDAAYYSLFYKRFAARLATQYKLHGLIDLVTSDVSRCCFMSYDPQAWYNPDAVPVNAEDFLDAEGLEEMKAANMEIEEAENAARETQTSGGSAENQLQGQTLPDDVLWQIKQKLNPALAARLPKTKNYFQPAGLTEALPALSEALQALGITLAEHKPISYGRQLKLKAGLHWAEVNLFYGKAGYKAIQTTKTGSHPQLAEMAAQAIQLHFDTLPVNIIAP